MDVHTLIEGVSALEVVDFQDSHDFLEVPESLYPVMLLLVD